MEKMRPTTVASELAMVDRMLIADEGPPP